MEKRHYYVYQHVNPITKEVVYIGCGKKDRAWVSQKNHRQPEHYERLLFYYDQGYTLSDIVVIVKQGLTKKEAHTMEQCLILESKPTLNRAKGLNSYVGLEELRQAKEMREKGMTFKQIANKMNTTTMTAYRWCQ